MIQKDGCDVYEVKYKPPPMVDESVLGRLLQPSGDMGMSGSGNGVRSDDPIRSIVRWFIQIVTTEIQTELIRRSNSNMYTMNNIETPAQQSPSTIREQYMAVDDTADRIRSQLD
jgi:hypothetical protein